MWQNKFFMKKKNSTDKGLAQIEEGLSKTEQFIEKNNRPIILIASGIVLLIILIFTVKGCETEKNEQSLNDLLDIQQAFDKNQFQKVLELDSIFQTKHSNSAGSNLSKYYVGISYYKLENYANSIETLDNFNSNDPILQSTALLTIGDAFSELDQPNDAIIYYKKALKTSSNNLTSPIALQKCARIYEMLEKYTDAIECYQIIKNDYPESKYAENIDKYINKIINEKN